MKNLDEWFQMLNQLKKCYFLVSFFKKFFFSFCFLKIMKKFMFKFWKIIYYFKMNPTHVSMIKLISTIIINETLQL